MSIVRQRITVQIARHEASGLIIAQSPELPALMVPGQTLTEIEERIPQSIREILEAMGAQVLAVALEDDDADYPRGFLPSKRHVEIRAAVVA